MNLYLNKESEPSSGVVGNALVTGYNPSLTLLTWRHSGRSTPSLENPLRETRTPVVRRSAHSLPRGRAAPRGESFWR
jgi:hypothetical protein